MINPLKLLAEIMFRQEDSSSDSDEILRNARSVVTKGRRWHFVSDSDAGPVYCLVSGPLSDREIKELTKALSRFDIIPKRTDIPGMFDGDEVVTVPARPFKSKILEEPEILEGTASPAIHIGQP